MPNLFRHIYIQYFQKCIVVFPITIILLFMQLIYAKLFADYITTYINKLFQMLHLTFEGWNLRKFVQIQ